MIKQMYGYDCEFCDGVVEEIMVDREIFRHPTGFIILENVPVGVCTSCGHRYYHASLLRRVEEISAQKAPPVRMEMVPVASYRQAA
ncbi:MAG: YgiT-type zinc finger protein [Caldilineaceae bacterium]|nr:YgiT-type zinc finger protein [Caldilineaceae bacterium]